ncbi:MAG: mucoidy inhibitor MuiA family protein, partial [Bacteroidia bacterium]|nr:mucoidy inhibitor MuiA family protein [Bacteroidia bacterium]
MRVLIIALAIAMCCPQLSFSEGKVNPTVSRINNVKVYLQGAFITRTVKANVSAGNTIVEVKGLSSSINAQSVSVKGSGDFTILSVNKQLNFIDESAKTDEVIKLEEELEKLATERSRIQNSLVALNEEQSVLQANKKITGDNTALSLQNLQAISTYVRNRTLEIKNEMIQLKVDEKKKQEEINKVNRQLNSLRSKTNKPSSKLEISVRSKAKQAINLEVSYMVNGAGWRPFYDLRVDDVTKPLNMEYKAQVYQNSGVDWDKVDLTLSTGNPSLGGTKPLLYPWYITYGQAAGYNRTNKIQNKYSKNYEGAVLAAPTFDTGMADQVSIQSQETSVDFNISIPYSVPSDGKEYLVDIQKFSLPAVYR